MKIVYFSPSPGTFIIPYFVMLFLLGIPLFYFELLLGQNTRKGPVGAWFKLVPNLAGIGVAPIVVLMFISLYYNVIIAWVIFYFVNSFHDPLPWAKCFGHKASGNHSSILANALKDNFTRIDELSACLNESTQ